MPTLTLKRNTSNNTTQQQRPLPANPSPSPDPRRLRDKAVMLANLAELLKPRPVPCVFSRGAAGVRLPLAIGTLGALSRYAGVPPEDTGKTRRLHRWLRDWTLSFSYLEGLASDTGVRFDLDGNPVGPVSEVDRLAAVVMLVQRDPATAPLIKPLADPLIAQGVLSQPRHQARAA